MENTPITSTKWVNLGTLSKVRQLQKCPNPRIQVVLSTYTKKSCSNYFIGIKMYPDTVSVNRIFPKQQERLESFFFPGQTL